MESEHEYRKARTLSTIAQHGTQQTDEVEKSSSGNGEDRGNASDDGDDVSQDVALEDMEMESINQKLEQEQNHGHGSDADAAQIEYEQLESQIQQHAEPAGKTLNFHDSFSNIS